MEKAWKEYTNELGETVKFWDEYKFLKNTYRMESVTTAQGLLIGDVFLDLDIEGFRSLSDFTKINPGKILNSLIKAKSISKVLSILLVRVDDKGIKHPCEPADFERGLLVNFKPFAVEVFMDFFSLNSELYSDIANFVNEAKDAWRVWRNLAETSGQELTKSITSAKAGSQKRKK